MKLGKKINRQYLQISIYIIITASIIYCLSLVAKNFPVIFSDVLDRISWLFSVVKPIILGFIFAYLLDPIVNILERRYKSIKFLKKRQNSCRTYAVLTTFLIAVIVIAGIISILVYSVTDQLRLANFEDIITLFKTYIESFNGFFNTINQKLVEIDIESVELKNYVKAISGYIVDFTKNFATNAMGSISNISGFVATLFFAIVIAIYFLIDGKMMQVYLGKVFRALFSEHSNKRLKGFLVDADTVFSGYIRGQLTDAFVMMILISIWLSVIGVKFAVVIGIFAGIGNLIPYCGPLVAYAASTLVCLLNQDIKTLIISLIGLVVLQAIDGNIIGPRLLSHSIHIHPLLVMISLIFGSAIGGLFGMLLAVPVGALIKVIFVRYIDSRIELKEAIRLAKEE